MTGVGIDLADLQKDIEEYRANAPNREILNRSEAVRQCITVGLPILEAIREDPSMDDPADMDARQLAAIGLECWQALDRQEDDA